MFTVWKKIEERIGLVTYGQIVSCGCLKNRNLVTKPTAEKLGQKYGTNISRIASSALQTNNMSGHKGVSLHRQKGKSDRWMAYIGFQGKRYYLGCYQDIDQAVKAREDAEYRIHKNFLQWYNETVKK